ncbi:hypothetical protein CCHR01_11058 [Colletotrichum chrysophilum]|uniref:Uncharacterized protein n=1 Tax=Colletotrichum chrysophilum TaxID=1836956 RepID=A0AAD9EF81_9PEZI|nr:hypothetical protein CCHR01_11058 [Colletotrichum chrysophilum]
MLVLAYFLGCGLGQREQFSREPSPRPRSLAGLDDNPAAARRPSPLFGFGGRGRNLPRPPVCGLDWGPEALGGGLGGIIPAIQAPIASGEHQ